MQGEKALQVLVVFPVGGGHAVYPSLHYVILGMNGDAIPFPVLAGSADLLVFLQPQGIPVAPATLSIDAA